MQTHNHANNVLKFSLEKSCQNARGNIYVLLLLPTKKTLLVGSYYVYLRPLISHYSEPPCA